MYYIYTFYNKYFFRAFDGDALASYVRVCCCCFYFCVFGFSFFFLSLASFLCFVIMICYTTIFALFFRSHIRCDCDRTLLTIYYSVFVFAFDSIYWRKKKRHFSLMSASQSSNQNRMKNWLTTIWCTRSAVNYLNINMTYRKKRHRCAISMPLCRESQEGTAVGAGINRSAHSITALDFDRHVIVYCYAHTRNSAGLF